MTSFTRLHPHQNLKEMSVSPKMTMPDLEKGRGVPSHSPTFAFPQRRRKVIIVVLFITALLLFVFASEQSNSSYSPSSWKWVKDSMRPAYDQTDNQTPSDAVSPPQVKEPIEGQKGSKAMEPFADQPFAPTPALVDFANKMKTPLPTSKPHDPAEMDGPSLVDQILLFLTAMKDASYRVPELQVQRSKELQPSSTADFVKTLAKIKADTADQTLYADSHSSWRQKHRAQTPLTIFSKSYCPYSKRAKALLTEMGAQFEVYEVDLREDAQSLQAGLKELSGHATFPTIFVRDELIGGYDDLARLQRIKVLKGILEGAGVKFTSPP